jgi:hypothetical protein
LAAVPGATRERALETAAIAFTRNGSQNAETQGMNLVRNQRLGAGGYFFFLRRFLDFLAAPFAADFLTARFFFLFPVIGM